MCLLVCAVGSLFYPLWKGFEISLAEVRFSDGEALKIDYFFFSSRLHYFPAGAIYVDLDLNISYLPINCTNLVKSTPLLGKSVPFGKKI